MFSKKQRLNTSEFDEVFNFGKIRRNEFFLLKYRDNSLQKARFAVVIPKKQIKLAIKRNLYKRRFMSILEKSELRNFKKDFVFVLNKNTFHKNKEEILLTISKLHLE